MDDLIKFREEIDNIDKELVKLFEERMNIVLKVATYKKEKGLDIFHEDREKEVIEKNLKKIRNKNLTPYAKEMLVDLMNISKKYQKDFIEKKRG